MNVSLIKTQLFCCSILQNIDNIATFVNIVLQRYTLFNGTWMQISYYSGM